MLGEIRGIQTRLSRRWPGGKGRSLETEMSTCFKAQVLDIMCILELGGNLVWLEWSMDIGGQSEHVNFIQGQTLKGLCAILKVINVNL